MLLFNNHIFHSLEFLTSNIILSKSEPVRAEPEWYNDDDDDEAEDTATPLNPNDPLFKHQKATLLREQFSKEVGPFPNYWVYPCAELGTTLITIRQELGLDIYWQIEDGGSLLILMQQTKPGKYDVDSLERFTGWG